MEHKTLGVGKKGGSCDEETACKKEWKGETAEKLVSYRYPELMEVVCVPPCTHSHPTFVCISIFADPSKSTTLVYPFLDNTYI